MALYKANGDQFSLQVRNVILGALSLGMGLSYSACLSYIFVLHDKTASISVLQQFGLLVLGALVLSLFVFAMITVWPPDYSMCRLY
jgi:hypothetical protein